MSITPPRPPMPSFIPESAPFTPVQRAWLNGLFAGVFGLEGGRDAVVEAGRGQAFAGPGRRACRRG